MKVLWLARVWPEPGSSAAGYRTAQLLSALAARGHDVEVCSPCRDNEHRQHLAGEGITTVTFQPNDSAFDAYVKQLGPNLVIFDRFMTEEQFAWRVREQCPEAIRVLDTIDLHSLRRTRQEMVKSGRNPLVLNPSDLHSADWLRELSAIFRSDCSLIISDAELELLQTRCHVQAQLLRLCRMHYTVAKETPAFDERRHFVVIGNFHHEPNTDSYRILQETLWAKIRTALKCRGERGAELHIYGAYPTKHFMQLDNERAGFRVKGWVDNTAETLQHYRVNLAPLRFGAGIKGKIAEGWSLGTPCVATSIAAEGMHEQLPFGGVVADDWDEFAEHAADLYLDCAKWETAKAEGRHIIETLFGDVENVSRIVEFLEDVAPLREARVSNFVGSMLWHHQHRSTEFFSRWIEAKGAANASAVE
ncbi:MAG: glycosyltransferase [Bdellovibrionota bacterium]